MFKPLALAMTVTLVAATAFAQDDHGAITAQPQDSASATSSASASSSPASSAASSTVVADTGTIATLDLPGASSSSSASGKPARPVVVPPDKKTLRRINDATVAYIRDQRGWMDGTYKITFYGYDGALVIMRIDLTQGDNAYNFVGAEGQPFKIEIDPKTLVIAAERY